MRNGSGDCAASPASALRRPRSSPTGCSPRASSRSSREAATPARAPPPAAPRPARVALQLAQRQVQRLAEHDEPLLGAVVQVAADPPALLVGGLHGARGDSRGAAPLVAAALELRAGAGGEHAQRLQLARLRVERAGGDHADVADRLAARVVQRDREVAVELVGGEERVFRIARAGAAADEQQLVQYASSHGVPASANS